MNTAKAKATATILALAASTPAFAQFVTPTSMTFSNNLRLEFQNGPGTTSSQTIGLPPSDFGIADFLNLSRGAFGDLDVIISNSNRDYFRQTIVQARGELGYDSGALRFEHGAYDACASQACGDGDVPIPAGYVEYYDRWSYSFTANQDAYFRFNYDLKSVAAGPFMPPSPPSSEFRDPFALMLFGPRGCIACDGATSGAGSFGYAVSAGQSYTFDLLSFSFLNISEGDAFPLFGLNYGYDLFSYSFSGAPIPEPANWALMIAGFGAVGGAMRRRAKVRVAYA